MENTDLHKQILLGLIRVNPDTDIKDFRRNYSTYETSVLRFTNDEDIDIAAQLKKFYGQYQEPPTINALIGSLS